MLPYPLRLAKERHGDTSVVLGTVSIDVRAFNSTHACAASRALHRSFEVPSELYAALRHTSVQRAAWCPMQSVSYLVSATIWHDAGWAHPIRRACVCHIHINAVFCARIE
jgi:hypothetical protein